MLNNTNISVATKAIKDEAQRIGFDYCGITKPEILTNENINLNNWLNSHKNAEMSFFLKNIEKRINPNVLHPQTKSIISLATNYYSDKVCAISKYKFAKFAILNDYHQVLKGKMELLLNYMNKNICQTNSRCFVDSAPVMERSWAVRSGLGWIGKNNTLITPNGSYYFLSEIFTDLELEYDKPAEGSCGNCTKCIDSCPTNALVPYSLDANKCWSYITVEHKIDNECCNKASLKSYIAGCDICQDVCPHNKNIKPTNEQQFIHSEDIASLTDEDLETISTDTFIKTFANTPISRIGYRRMAENIAIVKSNSHKD